MRKKRLKITGEAAWYHIMSRTVGGCFYLKRKEKEKLLRIIVKMSEVYMVEVMTFCIMGNHFHILVKVNCAEMYSFEEIRTKIRKYRYRSNCKDKDVITEEEFENYKRKLQDLSEYVKDIKQRFSVWYNRSNNRKGYFWGDRFKSVLIESGEALINCMAYIDLNPVRAGIVNDPESYRWSGVSYRLANRELGVMDFDNVLSYADCFNSIEQYLAFLRSHMGIEVGNNRWERGTFLMKRVKHFSESIVIGSELFLNNIYSRYGPVNSQKILRKHKFKELKEVYAT